MRRTRYALTPQAKNSLRSIRDYIARDNKAAAARMMDRFTSAFEQLAKMPGMGHVREDLADEALEFWAVGSYYVVYRQQTKPLEIVDVLHGARNIAALLGGSGASDEDEP